MPPVIEAVLSWTVREGATNVIRHSRARHCTVRVTRNTREACVEVVDDGTEILAPLSPHDGKTTSATTTSNGLRGLAERVAVLGGHCEAHAQGKGGFRLAVSVPLT
ncbi:MAG: hypothetical protein NVS4B12_20540 [Ktedonobacteraceae bacterium]